MAIHGNWQGTVLSWANRRDAFGRSPSRYCRRGELLLLQTISASDAYKPRPGCVALEVQVALDRKITDGIHANSNVQFVIREKQETHTTEPMRVLSSEPVIKDGAYTSCKLIVESSLRDEGEGLTPDGELICRLSNFDSELSLVSVFSS